jgi:hypothetical protein
MTSVASKVNYLIYKIYINRKPTFSSPYVQQHYNNQETFSWESSLNCCVVTCSTPWPVALEEFKNV